MQEEIITELRQIRKLLQERDTLSKGVLTIEQAAQYLGLSVSTLYHMTSQRKIPHYKPGGRIYFQRSQLDIWMLSNPKPVVEELPSKRSFNLITGKKKRIAA